MSDIIEIAVEFVSEIIDAVAENAAGRKRKNNITAAVKYGEPLKNYTTFRVGGRVRAMYFPEDTEAAVSLCEVLNQRGVSPYIIGNGSNILASDNDLNIVVINMTGLRKIALTETVYSNSAEITADCGVSLNKLADFARDNSLEGLEFAHGIPGTLGGAVMMNAGAYDGQMSDVVSETTAYNAQRGIYTLIGEQHLFSYRHSAFTDKNDIILSSKMVLKKGEKQKIGEKMTELMKRRRESQPLEYPSAGSTFKRPKTGYAAALIEQAGLKGYSIGGAQVSSKHSGFIINTGNAAFNDIKALIEHVQETVFKNSGVMLEPEVKIWNL